MEQYIAERETREKMKKLFSMVSVTLMMLVLCVGCAKKSNKQNETATPAPTQEAQTDSTTDSEAEPETSTAEKVSINIASLKGPTSLGLLQMMSEADNNTLANQYNFEIYQAADEIVTKVVKGEVDIALVPANVAANLYQKTSHQISVIDVNTLGVLYVVEHGETIQSVADLKGKTICMTGKGTVPEYALSYILSKNGLTMDDVTLEFKSEPAEVIAFLSAKSDAVGILPQPFVASATMQDDSLRVALDLTEQWNQVDTESTFITGVTIVRNDFLKANQDAVNQFLTEHAASVEYVNANVDEAAALAESFDIVKAAVAKNAIPNCNIVSITAEEMQKKLSGYLQTLFDANAESVGGTLPDEGFYYTGSIKE